MATIDFEDRPTLLVSSQVPTMLKALLRRWYIVVGGAVVGTLLAAMSLGGGPSFESAMSIAPSQGASATEGGGSTISSLAAIAGVGGSSQTLSPYDQLLVTLKSAELANAVFKDKPLMHEMFSARWDKDHQRWKTNTSSFSAIAHSIDESFGVYRPRDIGVDDVVAYLGDKIKITSDKTSAIRILSIRTPDPKASFDILNEIYRKADEIVRLSDAAFISEQVQYLERRLETVTNADHRQQLALILSDYEKRLMLAQGRSNYASRIVDSPQIARSPATPRPTIVLILGGLIGAIVGMGIVVFLRIRKNFLDNPGTLVVLESL